MVNDKREVAAAASRYLNNKMQCLRVIYTKEKTRKYIAYIAYIYTHKNTHTHIYVFYTYIL